MVEFQRRNLDVGEIVVTRNNVVVREACIARLGQKRLDLQRRLVQACQRKFVAEAMRFVTM